jgi:hypothetical protein
VSLYRQPGRARARTTAIVATVTLLIGGGIGYAIGAAASGDDAVSVSEAVAQLRRDLQPVTNGLELVTTEYPQGVKDGRVVAATEYGAAKADVARAQKAVTDQADDLEALAPERAAALRQTLAALATALNARADEATIDRLARQATQHLEGILSPAGS